MTSNALNGIFCWCWMAPFKPTDISQVTGDNIWMASQHHPSGGKRCVWSSTSHLFKQHDTWCESLSYLFNQRDILPLTGAAICSLTMRRAISLFIHILDHTPYASYVSRTRHLSPQHDAQTQYCWVTCAWTMRCPLSHPPSETICCTVYDT